MKRIGQIKPKAGVSSNSKIKLKRIGERIRSIRGKLKQTEFSDRLGVHRNTVQGWEAGLSAPSGETLVLFLEILKVNLNWLFSGKGEPYLDAGEQIEEPPAKPERPISRIVVINRSSDGTRRRLK